MNYILTGKMIRASQAKRLGLIDALVPERQLLRAARAFIESPIKRTHRWITFTNKILNNKWIRQGVSRYLRTQVSKKANPSHYPAPGMIIGNWERYGIYHPQAWQAEIEGVARLFKVNDTARHLLRVFFLQERLKSFSKKNACTWTQIHCIGAGTMGAGMAAWCALQGMRVTLHDPNRAAIAQAMASAHKLFKKHLKKPHLIQSAMDRLTPDFSGEGVKRADLIIEAAPEDLAIKRALFKAIEQQAKPEAVLATNTSSIPLDAINKVLENPQRLVGIHFFNPVSKMPLVEVVKGEQTSTSVYEQAMAFVGRIKRLPLPVKSAPGFLVNRILMPYLLEAMMLAEEGVPLSQIDAAAVEFGMPVGPIELADRVGLDVCLSVAQNLSQYFGVSIPKQLTALVQANHLGDKTKQGFYRYEKGKKQPSKARSGAGTTIDNREISERLIFIMLKEAMRCLDEKIVEDSDLLDASMIFGTGFAPFRGGLMHYAKTLGERRLKTSMKECHERYGERFAVTSQ